MATMRDIRRRIRSVNSTMQITKAMKMVAAAKLRRAQDRLFAMRPYSDTIEEMLGRLMPELIGDEHPLLDQREAGKGKTALLLVTSDSGLCGGFNVNLINTARAMLAERGEQNVMLSAIGRRGHDYFRKRGVKSHDFWRDIYDNLDMPLVSAISGRFVRRFREDEIDAVAVCYAHFTNAVTQRPTIQQILPIDLSPYRKALESEADREARKHAGKEKKDRKARKAAENERQEAEATRHAEWINLFEPSLVEVCAELIERRMTVSVMRCALESVASEHAARMSAMENATTNAEDMIDSLTLELNRARQSQITTEISEIVGGAEAMRG